MRVDTLNDSIPLFEIILMKFTYYPARHSLSLALEMRSRGYFNLSSEYKTEKDGPTLES